MHVYDKIPKEAWSGRRPSIRHLRVFGCIVYIHVLNQLMKKLDDKGERCIFIECNTNSNEYKLYNPMTNKMIISPYVTFDEKGIMIMAHLIRRLSTLLYLQIMKPVTFEEASSDENWRKAIIDF
ncbi:hypothetical protein CR513_40053, partial [Mucuna pruriens]